MAAFITPDEAAELIGNNMSVGIGGFATFGAADSILRAIRRRFDRSGAPAGLHLVSPACPGDQQEDGWGLSALCAPGLIASVITSHVGQVPALARQVSEDRVAAFLLPLGAFVHVFRAMTAGQPGYLTHVGLGTYVDPRVEGCAINARARAMGRELVSVLPLEEKEYLFYRPLPMDLCVIRGSVADEDGNISMDREAIPAEQVEMAHAVHNSGGTVIVQVEQIVPRHSLKPKEVWLHHRLVDYVVQAAPGEHLQTYEFRTYRPELAGECRVAVETVAPMELGVRKLIARRGAMEIPRGALVNLGLGISDGVANVANEEGVIDRLSLTIETGLFGGIPLGGLSMGCGVNADALYRTGDTFDLYDGGVLDVAFLSGAQIDEAGNVNVTRFGGRTAGPGGFIDISQNAPKTCFLGTFMAGPQKIRIEDGRLHIQEDGPILKFKKRVEQITFSGRYAAESGHEVMILTERAVFRLTAEGLLLTEIAPGVDLQRHILDKMEFRPQIAPELREMDPRLFRAEKMGLLSSMGGAV